MPRSLLNQPPQPEGVSWSDTCRATLLKPYARREKKTKTHMPGNACGWGGGVHLYLFFYFLNLLIYLVHFYFI